MLLTMKLFIAYYLTVVQNYLKPKELKMALEIIQENQDNFTRIWNEWFN